MNTRLVLVAALLLAGCGTTPNPAAQGRMAQSIAAQGAKADRPEPPTAGDQKAPKQGFAARQAVRSAERALYRYAAYLRDWERARTDEEKDRIEQDMLTELHSTLDDIVQTTSSQGHDQADRDCYDVADRSLDRYDRLFREWERARTDAEKRRIVNDMLTTMVQALNDIKRIR